MAKLFTCRSAEEEWVNSDIFKCFRWSLIWRNLRCGQDGSTRTPQTSYDDWGQSKRCLQRSMSRISDADETEKATKATQPTADTDACRCHCCSGWGSTLRPPGPVHLQRAPSAQLRTKNTHFAGKFWLIQLNKRSRIKSQMKNDSLRSGVLLNCARSSDPLLKLWHRVELGSSLNVQQLRNVKRHNLRWTLPIMTSLDLWGFNKKKSKRVDDVFALVLKNYLSEAVRWVDDHQGRLYRPLQFDKSPKRHRLLQMELMKRQM